MILQICTLHSSSSPCSLMVCIIIPIHHTLVITHYVCTRITVIVFVNIAWLQCLLSLYLLNRFEYILTNIRCLPSCVSFNNGYEIRHNRCVPINCIVLIRNINEIQLEKRNFICAINLEKVTNVLIMC